MENGFVKIIIAVIIGFFVIKTCSNNKTNQLQRSTQTQWQKSPVDKLIKELDNERNFSIILLDMDADDPQSSKPNYKHQYRIIIEQEDTVTAKETEWHPVSDIVFNQHVNDMGMEIASKKDGVVTKQVAPAGFNNYVGNERYGQWSERNGSSFWEFYGRYALMSSMFNMMAYPARRSYWNDYRGGYYGTGRSYYGPSGQQTYGTKSYTSSATGKTSKWGSKPSNFKNSVRSSVSRSAATSSRSYSSSKSYGNKTSRSSTRSSTRSSYRSRSGGFGK